MSQPDPSLTVPQDLMPHVHLVSSFRYPTMTHINLQEVAKWLMSAPHVARDKAPFFWTFLDKPADGTTLMTWQPLQRLATNFATDGYIWAPPEQLYKHDLGNGLIMEIYYLKAGYAPGDQFATHARRRFRLVPVPGHPNPHHPDSNLFVVHYGPTEQNETIPAHIIPYDERVAATMQSRHYILRGGQLRRKEFMLSDRANWPSLPEIPRQQMAPQMAPRGVPQQMAYPPQVGPGPPAKRARPNPQQQAGMPVMTSDAALDDDEDISRGDMFDHLTPKEISLARYQQNHEWMEEILSSPYRIQQITPADLGLGLKGELGSLTEGIFTAQGGDAFLQSPDKPYVGRLDPGKADEFRKRVNDHIESTKAEIEKMQAEHAQALAQFKEKSILSTKEKELRGIVEEPGPEPWRLEGQSEPNEDGSVPRHANKKTVEEILEEVESSIGRKINGTPTVKCIENGGYQPSAPEPAPPAQNLHISRHPSQAESQTDNLLISEPDIDMGGTAAGMLDEMHTGFSSNTTPVNNFPTPQAHISAVQSNAATPSNLNIASPAVAQPPATQGDINMGGINNRMGNSAPDQGTGSGDWVVVPKNGGTPEVNSASGNTPRPNPVINARGPSNAATPAVTEGGYDQNDFSSLGDLDSAGDALAGYGGDLDGSGGDMGDGLDLQMDMEDSAFGDAFHGVSASGTPNDGQGGDL